MKKNRMMIAGIALVIALSASYYLVKNRTPFAEKKPSVGDLAPAISLSDMNGNMVTLAQLKGKVVLVNFWASWCPPCTNEMPGFQKVFEAYEAKGFSVVGVALDDVKLTIIRDMRITYPVVKTNERVSREYGDVSGVPQSFLVSKDGRIIKKVNQFYPEQELRSDVEKALKGGF